MAKDVHLKIRKLFAIYKCENVLPFEEANSIDPNLRTCNLQTGNSISYNYVMQFRLNLPPSHLQMEKSFHTCKWISLQFRLLSLNKRNGFRFILISSWFYPNSMQILFFSNVFLIATSIFGIVSLLFVTIRLRRNNFGFTNHCLTWLRTTNHCCCNKTKWLITFHCFSFSWLNCYPWRRTSFYYFALITP